MIVQKADGGVAREDHVANYIAGLQAGAAGRGAQVHRRLLGPGGGHQVRRRRHGEGQSLKEAFAEDVALLQAGGPEAGGGARRGARRSTRTLERLGERSEFVDGLRVTDATSLPVVEMVLTGKVNQELVALLNARDAAAVGLSGKDGQLLRARKHRARERAGPRHRGRGGRGERDFLRMLLDSGLRPGHLAHRQRRGRRQPLHQRRRRGGGGGGGAGREEAHLPHRRARHPRVGARRRRWCARSPTPT